MKRTQRILLLLFCAVLLVGASVLGTIAYFTDSDAVTNTFTVGNVQIKLDEAKVNPDGSYVTDKTNRVDHNAYHLLPGYTYIKDPTVTVEAGSEESYVRMLVTVNFQSELTDAELATNLDNIFTGYDAAKWERNAKIVSADSKSITYEYRYYTTVTGGDNGKELEPLFTGFTVPGEYTNEQIAVLDGMTIDVQAHAIQAAGFDDADAAWTAFAQQHN